MADSNLIPFKYPYEVNDDSLLIFKYLSFKTAKKVIQEKTLKFDNPRNFNDPFDCVMDRLYFSLEEKSEEVLADLQLLENKFGSEIMKGFSNKKLEAFYRKSAEEKIKKSAVCCFSLTNTDPLMWSHYSDKHKGICLVFSLNKTSSAFQSIPYNKINQGSVNYPETDSPINYLKDKRSGIQNLIFTKSKHWKYEREFRIHSEIGPGCYKFTHDFLHGIIFGLRTTKRKRATFKNECVQSGFSNLNFGITKQNGLELDIHWENV